MMLKSKKYHIFLMLLPIFVFFSCSKPTNPCNVVRQQDNELEHLSIDLASQGFPTSYNNGDSIQIDKIEVVYNASLLTYEAKDYQKEDGFFITTNADYPVNGLVSNLEVTTNVENNSLTFFIAHYDNEVDTIYVSKEIVINIHNEGALKPWVWYVVSAVVIFLVVAMVVFTRRYKEKH